MKNVAHRVLQLPVAAIIAAYYLLTAIVRPIVRPIARALAKLRIVKAIRSLIERLGPYPSLLLLVVPIVTIEPLKIGALAILASGHIVLGVAALVISHCLSLLIERLFAVVKPKLLKLRWFAAVWGWITALRDRMLEWLHSAWAWSIVERIKNWSRATLRGVWSQ